MNHLCKCGCGIPTKLKNDVYLKGHSKTQCPLCSFKAKRSNALDVHIKTHDAPTHGHLCECGCGSQTYVQSHSYLPGHWELKLKKTQHGTNMSYRYGCRCDSCVRARLEYGQDTNLKRRYGISRERVIEMQTQQNGKCAICQNDMPDYFICDRMACVIDHCHKTGKVRGLLCSTCNLGLGSFRDNVEALERAAGYIRLHSECTADANRHMMVTQQ